MKRPMFDELYVSRKVSRVAPMSEGHLSKYAIYQVDWGLNISAIREVYLSTRRACRTQSE